jgi:4-amino-4-deoxy-L-arabinose transferase-like glycosyltransferase
MFVHNTDNWLVGSAFLSLVALASMIFLVGLGKRHLWNGETREAGIMAEMARSKDFVVPRLNGQPFLEKPPLYYWIASPVFRLLGENTYSAKIPSALAAIGGVLIVFILARKMGFCPSTAFVSAWVLATSAEYWSLGRQCMIDMTLCLFITGAMLSFFQASRLETNRTLWGAGFVLSLACAVMTKGLVGLAIPLSALTVWLLARKNISFRAWFLLVFGAVLCLVPVALWIYLLCRQLGGNMVYKAMLANSFGRFTGSYAEHVGPFYYYLMEFPPQLFPWVLFVPMACIFHFREIRRQGKESPSLFILAWFVVPFLLLCMSAGKRTVYLLPLYPAAALFVGQAVGAVLEGRENPTNWFRIPVGILVWTVILAPLGFICMHIYLKQPFTGWLLLCVLGSCMGIWAQRRLSKKNLKGFLALLAPALLAAYLAFDTSIAPIFNGKNSVEPLFKYCRTLKSEGIQIALVRPKEHMSGAAVFYLGSCVPALADKEDIERFLTSDPKAAVVAYDVQLQNATDVDILKSFRMDEDTMVVAVRKTVNGEKDRENRP